MDRFLYIANSVTAIEEDVLANGVFGNPLLQVTLTRAGRSLIFDLG